MMRVAGIVAEYHPFHKGHLFHLEQTKKHCDAVVAVMSGNYMQRGEPALFAKFARAEAAVCCGVDLVLELPFYYASRSADIFAFGGVRTLAALGQVTMLSFGADSPLSELTEQSAASEERIREQLAAGRSYAAAAGGGEDRPNNILALAYLRELKRIGMPMEPFAVQRFGAGHDADEPSEGTASGSYLRQRLLAGEDIAPWLPEESLAVYQREAAEGRAPVTMERAEALLLYTLRQGVSGDIEGMSEGLENRLTEMAQRATSYEEWLTLCKTKRYTMARLRRAAVHCMVGLTKEPLREPSYLRVLAANERGRQILRSAADTATLPILTKTAGFTDPIFAWECCADDLYTLLYPKQENRRGRIDYLTSPVML